MGGWRGGRCRWIRWVGVERVEKDGNCCLNEMSALKNLNLCKKRKKNRRKVRREERKMENGKQTFEGVLVEDEEVVYLHVLGVVEALLAAA